MSLLCGPASEHCQGPCAGMARSHQSLPGSAQALQTLDDAFHESDAAIKGRKRAASCQGTTKRASWAPSVRRDQMRSQ